MMRGAMKSSLFYNLFVLELANNHLGSKDRGLEIIKEYSSVVHFNNVKAAIKLQFRDVDSFVHKDFKGNNDIRYIHKTEISKLSEKEYSTLVGAIRNVGIIPMATPFDEPSVDLCVKLGIPILKLASSDVNDWFLIRKIAETRLPVITSTGGASEKDLDALVEYFNNRNIPLAINHCVSLYPSEDYELDLDQIDYLKERYPDNVIGFSTHEYHDWTSSMFISYAKGARTWERHIDIPKDGGISPYCSLPYQINEWFGAYHKARAMCGGKNQDRRVISENETTYLDALVRGVYAKKDIPEGYTFSEKTVMDDFYLAIPLQKGQLSCRELVNGERLIKSIKKDEKLTIDHIDGIQKSLRDTIKERGM